MRRVVHEVRSSYHRIYVQEDEDVRTLRFEHNPQSSMFLDDPFQTDIRYPAYFNIAFAIAPEISRILVLGLGGGTVVKQMWRDYPFMSLDVVEINPDVVDVARRLFALPDDERIRVVVADGREFVRGSRQRYDIIIMDAFDDDHVPPHLLTKGFMRELREHLAPGGVVAWNTIGHIAGVRSAGFRRTQRAAAGVWRHVWTFPVGGEDTPITAERNIILLTSDAEISDTDLVEGILDKIAARVMSL